MTAEEIYQEEYQDSQEAYYDDINYEAILNADYGYRTEETIAQNAKDIAKEHNLNEQEVKEELDKINGKKEAQEKSLESHLQENSLENTPKNSLENAPEQSLQSLKNENTLKSEKTLEKEKTIDNSLSIENPKVEEFLQTAMALKEVQKNIKEAEEERKKRGLENNLSPKEKLDIANNTLREFESNRPLVKEAIESDLTIKAYDEEINELLIEQARRKQAEPQIQEQTQEAQAQSNAIPNITATKDSNNANEENKFANLTDEQLEEKIEKLKEQRESEQEHLKELITDFEPKDIAELLQQLYKMDKALAELIGTHQDLKLAESERKIREFEALLQKDKMQALTQIVSDISDKYIKLQDEKEKMLESKKEYENLNALMAKNEKPEIIKDKMEKINQKFPNFSKDYPTTTKRANEYAKGNAPQQQTQQQNQSQGRNL